MSACDSKSERIRLYYRSLFSAWGRQHWWPAESRFEVIVGAYLTQNTSWGNVEKAMRCLRQARVFNVVTMREIPIARLEKLIRSAGYFRQKAHRLKAFIRFLDERYAGSLTRMFAQPTAQLREELLSLNGIGPETADSILLYAGNHPVFVVDAYTRRILERHGIINSKATYEEIRSLCEGALTGIAEDHGAQIASTAIAETRDHITSRQEILTTEGTEDAGESRVDQCFPKQVLVTPSISSAHLRVPRGSSFSSAPNQTFPKGTKHRPSRMSLAKRTALAQVFNEMHGLIVGAGKNYCKKSQMQCERCPLQKFLPDKS